jgi:hypothetical protein
MFLPVVKHGNGQCKIKFDDLSQLSWRLPCSEDTGLEGLEDPTAGCWHKIRINQQEMEDQIQHLNGNLSNKMANEIDETWGLNQTTW